MPNFIRALCVVFFFGSLTACAGGGKNGDRALDAGPVILSAANVLIIAALKNRSGGGNSTATPMTVTNPEPTPPPPQMTMTMTTGAPTPTMTMTPPPPPVTVAIPSLPPSVTVTVALNNPYEDNPTNWRDNEYRLNWGIDRLGLFTAYQDNSFGWQVTIAVVDSGVRGSHDLFDEIGFRLEGVGNIHHLDNVLIGIGRRFDQNGMTLDDEHSRTDSGSQGTGVAGIIAGGFGRNSSFRFLGHGVAVASKVVPLRIAAAQSITITTLQRGVHTTYPLNGDPRAAFRYAMDLSVHIVNNSWGSGFNYYGHYGGDQSATIAFGGPLLPQALQMPAIGAHVQNRINEFADIVGDRDVAFVWAAGDDGWNSETGMVQTYEVPDYEQILDTPRPSNTYSPRQLVSNFVAVGVAVEGGPTISLSFNRGATITMGESPSAPLNIIDAIEPDGFGDYALAPLYRPELRGRWLAVVATDRNNNIASFSNGCGSLGKHWCLAAPGVSITTAGAGGDQELRSYDGTPFAAAHVSGALAVLKDRFRHLPMPVLVHILLTTATDLGAPGVDDVYGHGLINVGAASDMHVSITLAGVGLSLTSAQNTQTEVPPSFAGFAKRLNGIGLAAEYLKGFYYDAPLGGMIRAKHSTQPPLNFAAGLFDGDKTTNEDGVFSFSQNGALRAAGWQKGVFQFRHNFHNKPSLWKSESGEFGQMTRRPFFADDGGHSDEILLSLGDNFQLFAARGEEQKAEYSQMGISWRRQFSSFPRLQMAAAHSHIAEDETLLGGKFGGVMPLTKSGAIRQTDIGGSYALDKRWRIFGGYQRADIGAKFGGIVGEMSGVVAEGWRGGFAASNWLRRGDNFRIGIGREASITRGQMALNINQSANPQLDESTQAMHHRGYQTRKRRIDLSQESPLYFNAGYAFAPGDNSQLAIAANYRRHSPSAISIDWRWNF